MAAPTFVAAGAWLTAGYGNGSAALASPAGAQVNDIVLAYVYKESADAITAPAGFNLIATLANNVDANQDQWLSIFWKRVTSTPEPGTYNFTWTESGQTWRTGFTTLWRGAATSGSPIETFSTAMAKSGSTTTPAVSLTTGGNDRTLVFASSIWDVASMTGPTGYTQTTPGSAPGTRVLWGAYQTQATPGATGNVTATYSTSSFSKSAFLAALLPSDFIVGPVTDSGPTSETTTVTKTEVRSVTPESAPTTDSATVFVDWPAIADSGPTTETVALQQLDQRSTSDTATTSETIGIIPYIGKVAADSAPTAEVLDVVRINFVDLAETAPTSESTTLLQQLAISDSGPAQDSILGLGGTVLTENAPTDEQLTVTVIPFTQVLPLRDLTVYDLVVVARVPQASGPPAYIEIDPIEWKSLQYSNELSQPQDLTATCQISSVTEPILQRLRRLHELATELWLYRQGELIFAGPLQGFQTSGETLTLKARGLLSYLRMMVIQADLKFANVDQFAMVKSMVDQWQALSYGHFGIDTSGIGLSGVVRTQDYLRDELHNVGSKIEELGKAASGFDIEVNPATRRLELWYPIKGIDRSVGEDAIVLDSRNISSGDIVCSVAPGDLASESYGTAKGPGQDSTLYSIQSNLELRARYGRVAVTSTYSEVTQQSVLDDFVEGVLDARSVALLLPGPKVRVTPDADLSDYGVGDLISYDLAGELGIFGTFRIRKATVNASPTGQETVDLEFV